MGPSSVGRKQAEGQAPHPSSSCDEVDIGQELGIAGGIAVTAPTLPFTRATVFNGGSALEFRQLATFPTRKDRRYTRERGAIPIARRDAPASADHVGWIPLQADRRRQASGVGVPSRLRRPPERAYGGDQLAGG